MKPLLPFALLGSVGVAGVVAGTHPSLVSKPTTPSSLQDVGPVHVEASFERTHLSANATGETFARVALTGIAAPNAKAARVPVSLTLVIDRSGSMGSEEKMDAAEDAACKALAELQQGDRFAVVSFDNGAEVLASNVTVGRAPSKSADYPLDESRIAACRDIKALSSRGGTDMLSGLQVGGAEALRIASQGRVNRLLLLSDGQPDSIPGLSDRSKELARSGVTTTTIGLGTDYNEDLMASIADAGLGNSWFVESRSDVGGGAQQLAKIFQTELASMAEVVANNASITLTPKNGLEVIDVAGFPFDHSGASFIIPVGDIYGGRTTDVLVRVRHGATAAGVKDLLDVNVGFKSAEGNKPFTTTLAVNATFTTDIKVVTASTVPEVAIKSAEWQTSTAMLEANEAYNRGDFGEGDKILAKQKAMAVATKAALKTDKLDGLLDSVDTYQMENSAGGMGTRASMNKKAKAMARDVSRATGSYKK